MYRIIIFFQLFLSNVIAQNSNLLKKSNPVSLKIGTGISSPTLVRKDGFDEAYSPGFHFLFYKKFKFRNEIYSGVNINGIGIRKTTPFIKYESYYAAIPLIYRYEIVSNLSIEMGVQQNLPFFTRLSKLNGENSSGRESKFEKRPEKQLTFFNGGISIKMNEQFSISTVYGHPITPIQNISFKIDTSSYNFTIKNNQIQILFTYNIPQIEKQKNDREIAKLLINELKNGSLLLMLPDKSIIQENLIKKGKLNEANEIDFKIKELCKNIISISQSNFNFCSIYFFFPDKLEQIKNHNYSNCFVDQNLMVNNQINTAAESKTMIAHLYLNENSVNKFNENHNNEIFADYILIKDAEDFKVSYPFPYEISVNPNAGAAINGTELIIKKLNSTLSNYYLKKNH